jgi:hypothetical protein
LHGNRIEIITVKEMLDDIKNKMGKTKTVASSDVGRLLQVIKASGWE